MNVLINSAEKVSYNLQNNENEVKFINREEVVGLLKEKIEEAIINDKQIIVITNSCFETRNSLCIEDYDIDQEHFYLNGNKYELHIKSENITDIKYDNTYDEQFVITCGDEEIDLLF